MVHYVLYRDFPCQILFTLQHTSDNDENGHDDDNDSDHDDVDDDEDVMQLKVKVLFIPQSSCLVSCHTKNTTDFQMPVSSQQKLEFG